MWSPVASAAEPPARFWHSFTGNGGTTPASSRLYVFGGQGGETGSPVMLGDFWYYRADTADWTVAPTGRLKPGVRDGVGLSCGRGKCLLSNGRGFGLLKESWTYTESTSTWSKLNCKRYLCPPARGFPSAAYDPVRDQHVLFGGMSGDSSFTYRNDTYTFSAGRWSARAVSSPPPRRATAAASFVGGSVNKVVMYGGAYYALVQDSTPYYIWKARCDMWAWDGFKWLSITMTNSGPCLAFPAMVWDVAAQRLIVASGESVVNGAEIKNHKSWYFQFDGPTTGHWSQTSSSFYSCAYTASPMALMAYDVPTSRKVFFGGGENVSGGVASYANTTVCD